MNDCLVIVDGNSLFNRAFYALPALQNKDGEFTNAVYGFATMLIKVINDIQPQYLAVAFDLKAPTFRHKLYDGYKATRKPMPDQLRLQVPLLKHMLDLMGIKRLELEGYEADDILGTVAKKSAVETIILTGDRDALQLIDQKTTVYLTLRGISEIKKMDIASLKEEWGLTPAQIVDFKAICGDASDNITGICGIGDKGAKKLLEAFGSLKTLYERVDELSGKQKQCVIEGKESAFLSYELAKIATDIPLEFSLEDFKYPYPFNLQVKDFFRKMEFKSLLKRDDLFKADNATQKEKSATKPEILAAIKTLDSLDEIEKMLSQHANKNNLAFLISASKINVSFDSLVEYEIPFKLSLLDNGLEKDAALSLFKNYFLSEKSLLLFDAKATKSVLNRYGIKVKSAFFDAKLAQYLIDGGQAYDEVEEFLRARLLNESTPASSCLYALEDIKADLSEKGIDRLYYDVELKLVDILLDMESEGFCLDLNILNQLNKKYVEQIKELTEEIYKAAGEEFNLNSPKQLGEILFEKLGLPASKKGKSGSYATGADILEKLYDAHPIIPLILRYRMIFKLNSTYIEGFRKLMDEKNRVHTEFKQMLTTTGRLSSVEPNLQNLPIREDEGRMLRSMFVASNQNILVRADYSQIELRLLAHFSLDARMLEIYNNNQDIHQSTAAAVFSVPLSEVTSSQRRAAKAVNFGIIYGMSDFGLAQTLLTSRKKAREFIDSYFNIFKDIKKYLDDCVASAKKCGYAQTILGRRRKLPELFSNNYMVRSFAERAAMNMPLQGSAADLIKLAMVRVSARLKGMRSKLVLQVHDELVIDTHIDELDEVKALLKYEMENALSLKVPLVADVSFGRSLNG